jgi:mono/diheme cytochrome c family protein
MNSVVPRRATFYVLLAVAAMAAMRLPGAGADVPATAASSSDIDFVRDIQPIFAQNCYKCHDAAKHKGGLRLDSKATAFVGGDSGDASLIPHDPDQSKIIQLVRGDDPKSVMPPKGKGEPLTARQIDLIVRWVKQGANWPDGVDHPLAALTHWSFNKPVAQAIPPVKNGQWVRNPLDNFILARLEKEGLAPSPEADRCTLIRRLSFDLIGLPPTRQETEEFVTDKSPDAYDKLVDRLLANPHFGEKWARHWLDLARYADSSGYGSDPLRYTTYRWRDWVISAFNRNEPYDEFTIEQIAGDLLPHPTTEQLIATAFNRNTMTNTEGGTDPEEYRIEAIKDRTDTTVQVWMGLTMGCAKCHTHKYDPITNREYYQVFSIFNQTEDANRADESPTIPTPTDEQIAKMDSLKVEIAREEAKLKDPAAWTEAQAKWEKSVASQPTNWTALTVEKASASSGATLTPQLDESILAAGPVASEDVYTISAHSDLANITGFRLEALPDPSLPKGGPGRNENGGFVLNDFRVALPAGDKKAVHGRYVRIELPGHDKILSLAEVQAFHGSENIAIGGKAKQSTTDFDGPAKLAIDGNTDGDFRKAHSTTHTAKSESPWWEVDLKKAQDVDKLVIWNRTDENLGSRLSNFRILVLDDKHEPLWQKEVAAAPDPNLTIQPGADGDIALSKTTDTFHQTESGEWTAQKAIESDHAAKSGWAILPEVGRAHSAVFETAHNVASPGGTTLVFTLHQKFPSAPLGRFRLSATGDVRPIRALPEELDAALAVSSESRSSHQKDVIFQSFLATSPDAQAARDRVARLMKEEADVKPAVTAVMRELPAGKQRPNHILVKGNFLSKGAVVVPAVPAAFNPLPTDAPHDRLGLAEWIVARDNPLTARVEVNRIWAQLFAIGIVETQEDFGTQGQLPSNQPLLDWLAIDFMDSHWDMKRMIKLIVTSAAYRQSSRVSPELDAKDPDNRLTARGASKRLDAELVRDEALSLSGLLSQKMFGPSVFPPQPDGLWQAAFNGQRTYPTSTGEDRYRRGIYTFWRRTVPYPSMAAFDAPSREVCTIRRIQTSTPLQAFVTLNDPVYVECAQALARRIILEGGAAAADRAKFALELCLCRPAKPREIERLVSLHDRELDKYSNDEKAAKDLATSERGPLPSGVKADDAAAWTVCANVLLNMDGVLTKR